MGGGPLPNTPFPPHGLRLLVPPDFENVVAPLYRVLFFIS